MVVIVTLAALLGSIYALLGENGLGAVMQMRGRATQLRYEISARERDNRDVRDVIRPLREGDPDAVEQLAREKLYMVRPGDTVYVLPPESGPKPPVMTESGSPMAPSVPSGR